MINYKLILLLLITSITSSCSSKNDREIAIIKIYKFPSSINHPVDIGDSWIEDVEPVIVTQKKMLNNIQVQIDSLKKDNKNFNDRNIKIKCLINYSNGEVSVLDYNGYQWRVDGTVYQDSPSFVKVLNAMK